MAGRPGDVGGPIVGGRCLPRSGATGRCAAGGTRWDRRRRPRAAPRRARRRMRAASPSGLVRASRRPTIESARGRRRRRRRRRRAPRTGSAPRPAAPRQEGAAEAGAAGGAAEAAEEEAAAPPRRQGADEVGDGGAQRGEAAVRFAELVDEVAVDGAAHLIERLDEVAILRRGLVGGDQRRRYVGEPRAEVAARLGPLERRPHRRPEGGDELREQHEAVHEPGDAVDLCARGRVVERDAEVLPLVGEQLLGAGRDRRPVDLAAGHRGHLLDLGLHLVEDLVVRDVRARAAVDRRDQRLELRLDRVDDVVRRPWGPEDTAAPADLHAPTLSPLARPVGPPGKGGACPSQRERSEQKVRLSTPFSGPAPLQLAPSDRRAGPGRGGRGSLRRGVCGRAEAQPRLSRKLARERSVRPTRPSRCGPRARRAVCSSLHGAPQRSET